MCRNNPRCGFCGGLNHATDDCMLKEDKTKHRCVPCGTLAAKHPSWDYNCPTRAKQAEAAKLAYNTRPTLFQERTQTAEAPPKTTPIFNFAAALEPKERPWQVVGPKRAPSPRGPIEPQAKRPQGRPRGSTSATRDIADIRTFQIAPNT
jgi:hypothetical protein